MPVVPTDAGQPDTSPREGRPCAPVGGGACESSSKVLVCEMRSSPLIPNVFVGYECSRCTGDGGAFFCDFSAVPAGVKCPAFAEGVAHCTGANAWVRCSAGEFRAEPCDGGCVGANTADGGTAALCRP